MILIGATKKKKTSADLEHIGQEPSDQGRSEGSFSKNDRINYNLNDAADSKEAKIPKHSTQPEKENQSPQLTFDSIQKGWEEFKKR